MIRLPVRIAVTWERTKNSILNITVTLQSKSAVFVPIAEQKRTRKASCVRSAEHIYRLTQIKRFPFVHSAADHMISVINIADFAVIKRGFLIINFKHTEKAYISRLIGIYAFYLFIRFYLFTAFLISLKSLWNRAKILVLFKAKPILCIVALNPVAGV